MKIKSLTLLVPLCLALVGCVKYDDSDLKDQLKNHEDRISALETLCAQMNTNISSLQVAVNVLRDKDLVQTVAPVYQGGAVIGYTIVFEKAGNVTIYHGQNGKNGKDGRNGKDGKDGQDGKAGTDGQTPVIGVKQDVDGLWYWTLNGEWIKGTDDSKVIAQGVPGADGKDGTDGEDGTDGQDGIDGKDGADGVCPQLKIQDGFWYVSMDKGTTWEKAGQATGDAGDSMFEDIKVGEESVIFTLADGTEFSIPKSSAINIPTGIIMLNSKYEDVLKGDTLFVDFIVNPSDFPLKKEHLSLMISHDIYTKMDYTFDEDGNEGEETPFDATAHCDFEIVDIAQNSEYPGAYRAALAVSGEGNFFDDATMYLLAGDKNGKGDEHYTCANTPFDVHVIPWLSEGLTIQSPQQSFYTLSVVDNKEGGVKPFVVGIWTNQYHNEGGMYRFYDRSKVSEPAMDSNELKLATKSFADSLFHKAGVVTVTPDVDSEFWKTALDDYAAGKTVCAALDSAVLAFRRGAETASIPFDYKAYFPCFYNEDVTTTGAEITAQSKKMVFEMKDKLENAGFNDEYSYMINEKVDYANASTGGHFVGSLDKTTMELKLSFYNIRPTIPEDPCRYLGYYKRSLKFGQDDHGVVSDLPSETLALLNFGMTINVEITE